MGKGRTDKPELILIAAKNWFPIKVVIEGKARRMTVMYLYKGEFKTYFPVTTALFTSATTHSDFGSLKFWFPKMGGYFESIKMGLAQLASDVNKTVVIECIIREVGTTRQASKDHILE